jgi:hypothetical protein
MDLDETELKTEIDRISDKIDAIMRRVNRLYPQQELKSPMHGNASENADEKPSCLENDFPVDL